MRSKPGQAPRLAALLAVVMVAGGCATGKGVHNRHGQRRPDTVGRSDRSSRRDHRHNRSHRQGRNRGKPKDSVTDVLLDGDKRHEWLGRTFASVVDATDKAFGEDRVEDREEIVRAKVGLRVEYKETEDTK